MERWHPEKNTFYIPFGETTISLDDVACLLSLPVMGKLVCLPEDSDPPFPVDLLVTLRVSHSESRDKLNTKGGVSIRLDWFKDRFNNVPDNNSEVRIMCAVKAYLLYVLGCTSFGDKSGTRVTVDYLVLLTDIHVISTYTHGVPKALLSYIDNLVWHQRVYVAQIAGYLTLLQACIFSQFPIVMLVTSTSHKPEP